MSGPALVDGRAATAEREAAARRDGREGARRRVRWQRGRGRGQRGRGRGRHAGGGWKPGRTRAPEERARARALMRPYALVYLYRRRLRVHAAQELLAGLGVAIAVALVFAVLVADESIARSAAQVVKTVTGPATLQLRARGPEGFDARVLERVERLPGVAQAAGALELEATLARPGHGGAPVYVVGAQVSLATLDGLAHTLPSAIFAGGGVGLTRASAARAGITRAQLAGPGGATVDLAVRGTAHTLPVSAIVGPEAAGPLAQAQVAMMPLGALQRLAGMQGRLTRVLVVPAHGRGGQVRSELARLAGGGIEVAGANQDVSLLRGALRPSGQASAFFAAIAILLGLLFAFNAMLLTVPERRQAIADLRIDGTRRAAIAQMVLFQGLVLGLGASLAGLAGGCVLCTEVFHESPGYLAQTFVLGGGTVIGALPVALALAGGVGATCLASAVPLLDLRRGQAIDAVYYDEGAPGNALSAGAQRRLALGALALLVPACALFVLVPGVAMLAAVLLALATVLVVPLTLACVLRVAGALCARARRLTTLPVALVALRATTLRSLALAATGAIALFGSIALGGARADLLGGLERFASAYSHEASLWVLTPGDTSGTVAFATDGDAARIAAVHGVARVEAAGGEFVNLGSALGGGRAWLIATPPGLPDTALHSQLVAGRFAQAAARLRGSGWVAVSQQIAATAHVGVGGALTLPTPAGPRRFRVAATITNFGWTSGAVLVSEGDFARLWGRGTASALAVTLSPGANVQDARTAIARVLRGRHGGLEVITPATRKQRFDAIAAEGLATLGQIAALLAIAAVLAMAAALGSTTWERRVALSGLRLEGAPPRRLRKLLLTESALMLVAGSLTGVLAGILGQVVIDGYLARVTGFPVATVADGLRPLEVLVAVVAIVLALAALPTWSAARVPPSVALEME